jgi:hypothetical protein
VSSTPYTAPHIYVFYHRLSQHCVTSQDGAARATSGPISCKPEGTPVALQAYPTLTAGAGSTSDYQLWESYVHRPWQSTFGSVSSMWWDLEACARQLPYHRIVVALTDSYSFYQEISEDYWCGTLCTPAECVASDVACTVSGRWRGWTDVGAQ